MVNKQNWRFGVVGNIKKSHIDKDGNIRFGTKPFTCGTKVYLEGKFWCNAMEDIGVIGINRFGRMAYEHIPIDCIENLRVKKIYNPKVLNMIYSMEALDGKTWWDKTSVDKKQAKSFVKNFQNYKVK